MTPIRRQTARQKTFFGQAANGVIEIGLEKYSQLDLLFGTAPFFSFTVLFKSKKDLFNVANENKF